MKEDLFTAARRALRDFSIDMDKGGLITPNTEQSMGLLRQQVLLEELRRKETGEQQLPHLDQP